MKEDELISKGYEIRNAKITHVDLSMEEHGVMVLSLVLDGGGWGCNYGGYVIGKGYVGADYFEGSAKGMESIMQIMDVVGVGRFNDMKGKYVRCAIKGWGESVKIIGNIIKNKWFDIESFFAESEVKVNSKKNTR